MSAPRAWGAAEGQSAEQWGLRPAAAAVLSHAARTFTRGSMALWASGVLKELQTVDLFDPLKAD